MAERLGRSVRRKEALQLIGTPGAVADAEFEREFGKRAFLLPDGSLLTELQEGRVWRLWFSRAVYIEALRELNAKPSYDPVLEAVGDFRDFLEARSKLIGELLTTVGAPRDNAELAGTLGRVDAFVKRQSGHYWTDDRQRLRSLLAYIGDVICEKIGGSWVVEPDGTPVVETSDGHRLQIGRVIMGQANEARRGAFSVQEVIEELGRPK
jgi:hypothetical protein